MFIKEKVLGRIERRKTKLPTRVDQTTLVQLVLKNILSYTTSNFKVPITVCNELDIVT